MYYYRAFGLNIKSEIYLPKLKPQTKVELDDVCIICAKVPHLDTTDDKETGHCQLFKKDLLLNISDVARFQISSNTITIDIDEAADMQTVRLYLLGSGLGALMLLRNKLLLHGNAIDINGKGIIVVAKSGIGKSTLAAEFFRRGYSLLADDVCCIDEDSNIQPSYPYMKIWQNSIDHLKLPEQNIEKIRVQDEKFYYPIGKSFNTQPIKVHSIYILNKFKTPTIKTFEVKGFEKVKRLKNHLYRPLYSKILGIDQQIILQLSKLAQSIPVTHLARPIDQFSAPEIADLIVNAESNSYENL